MSVGWGVCGGVDEDLEEGFEYLRRGDEVVRRGERGRGRRGRGGEEGGDVDEEDEEEDEGDVV